MEPNLDATVLQTWARAIDEGPFSSLCWGERIAFDNPDNLTLLGALAAWTERVRLVTTVIVPQLHDPVMLAKASVDLPGLSSRSDLLTQGPTVGVPTQRAGGFPSTRAAGDAEGRPGSVKGAVAAGRIRPVMANGHRNTGMTRRGHRSRRSDRGFGRTSVSPCNWSRLIFRGGRRAAWLRESELCPPGGAPRQRNTERERSNHGLQGDKLR
jgi:Luciferase-like monooxygenase